MMAKIWMILIAAVLATVAWTFHPVCVPLSAADLQAFTVPIEQRTDRDFYLRVFQQRDGVWCQCKTWLSRQMFF